MHSISIYGSHDASISIRIGADSYRVYELERLTGKRYYSLNKDPEYKSVLDTMYNYLKEWHGITQYDSVFWCECEDHILLYIMEKFQPHHMEKMQHHVGHAACALWQSPFDQALIISFDGGGLDNEGVSYFNLFIGDKKDNSFKKVGTLPLDICSAYTLMAWPLNDVKKNEMDSYLSWAGKIMGLVAYGNRIKSEALIINNESIIEEFYYGNIDLENLKVLFKKWGYSGEMNSITDFESQADIAYLSQKVFEKVFWNAIQPFIHKYHLPVCLTGGGALNVLNNQALHDRGIKLFIPCNPNDCGLSLGFMLSRYQPHNGKMDQVTYSGFPLLQGDTTKFMHPNGEGKIIGLVQGDSEVGPRALGNRSLLAYPLPGIKEKLNTIKDREWYRPVSPVCRWEDFESYYGGPESEFMSFSQLGNFTYNDKHGTVAGRYINAAIKNTLHVDDTARLQTVKKEQNPLLHDLLSEINNLTGIGVLINTSFNIQGKPILTTYQNALQALMDSEIDGVYFADEGYLYYKMNRTIFKY